MHSSQIPHQFLFLCPVCNAEDSVHKNRCTRCGTRYTFEPDGVRFQDQQQTYSQLLHRMRRQLSIEQTPLPSSSIKITENHPAGANPFRLSQQARLRQGRQNLIYSGYHRLFRRKIEKPEEIASGQLLFFSEKFIFTAGEKSWQFLYSQLTCVTTNSHYFEFKVKHQSFYQIDFAYESPLKYEILFQKILSRQFAPRQIMEFQPWLRFAPPFCTETKPPQKAARPMKVGIFEYLLKRGLILLLHLLFWPLVNPVVCGREHLPKTGPFFVIVNHQSVLDPFLLLVYLDDRIAFLTKSTSFNKWHERLFLTLGRGIPTTRYQPDPTVVYHVANAVAAGLPVGIFPEGERCWDGKMQNFKLSVVRTLAAFRQPIVPVVLNNAFQFLPRWRSLPRRGKITIVVKPPFCLSSAHFSCEALREFLESQFR